MPKLSVITINLNNKNGLQKTIESVIKQTSNDFEYIVIDGGSTDGSVEVIKQYSEKILYWISEKDNGIYNAMNKGILKGKGDYCQFLNSGDYLVDKNVLDTVIPYLGVESIVYGNMLKMLKGRIYRNNKIDVNSMLTHYRGALNHSSSFIKRELFTKYGLYDERYKIVSDWKFFLVSIALNNESVRYIDKDITYFDMNGISNKNIILDKEERRQVLEEYLPKSVIKDYDNFGFEIEKIKRLRRYKVIYKLLGFIERALFKYEKFRYRKNTISE